MPRPSERPVHAKSCMSVEDARHDLLSSNDPWLERRRTIATIAGLLATEFAVVGMRQYGVIRRLPDPPGFDSNAVVTSRAAYPLGIPDSTLAVVGAGALMATALAGGTSSSGRARWLDLALGAGIVGGVAGAAIYLHEMVRMRRACAYCIVGASGFVSLLPLAARGVLRALSKR
jgi:uncharacterized membrane protein